MIQRNWNKKTWVKGMLNVKLSSIPFYSRGPFHSLEGGVGSSGQFFNHIQMVTVCFKAKKALW